MKRREFIAGLGGAVAWPLVVRAQQTDGIRRVGVLGPFGDDDPDAQMEMAALRQGIAEHGWIEGRTIDIAVRWPGFNIELIESSAKELVQLKPDVLLSRSTPATAALKAESGGIPIVFVNVSEPVEQGFGMAATCGWTFCGTAMTTIVHERSRMRWSACDPRSS